MHKILVIDDEESIRRVLKLNLDGKGFQTEGASSATAGIEKVTTFKPNLIILDLGLPDRNGYSVLKEIRQWSNVPIIVLTVSDDEKTKVELLEQGADDYITKPFSMPELMARIQVAFRHQREVEASPLYDFDDLKIDLNKREVVRRGTKIHLTSTEFDLLRALVKAQGQVLKQESLLTEVWGRNASGSPHYLRIYIGHLRKKVEEDPSNPKHILTEPGVGYRMV